jgi:hypothetical protein
MNLRIEEGEFHEAQRGGKEKEPMAGIGPVFSYLAAILS